MDRGRWPAATIPTDSDAETAEPPRSDTLGTVAWLHTYPCSVSGPSSAMHGLPLFYCPSATTYGLLSRWGAVPLLGASLSILTAGLPHPQDHLASPRLHVLLLRYSPISFTHCALLALPQTHRSDVVLAALGMLPRYVSAVTGIGMCT
jgi:hypothetical protein